MSSPQFEVRDLIQVGGTHRLFLVLVVQADQGHGDTYQTVVVSPGFEFNGDTVADFGDHVTHSVAWLEQWGEVIEDPSDELNDLAQRACQVMTDNWAAEVAAKAAGDAKKPYGITIRGWFFGLIG